MKLFKLRHKPTGLYFTPVGRGYAWDKSNLSEIGKFYEKAPTFKKVNADYLYVTEKLAELYNIKPSINMNFYNGNSFINNVTDWEIVTFTLKEIETKQYV